VAGKWCNARGVSLTIDSLTASLCHCCLAGTDERELCMPKTYPYTAVGQLEFSVPGGYSTCSGALFRPDRVLTAGHCVWEGDSFVTGILFAP